MQDLFTVPFWITVTVGICTVFYTLRPQLKFIYHCFIRPIEPGRGDQKTRLDQFYEGQADIYDATRGGLLRGRNTMISLSASHLRVLRETAASQRLVWIDIGGGTGRNIEVMDSHFPISTFDAIYLIDLCEPLLRVARDRIAKKGWKNVTVLCQDAAEFWLPEWSDGEDPQGSVSFVTMSYSITMIPRFYTVFDRVDYVLSREHGLFGVADFYTAARQESLIDRSIGGLGKECGWFTRWFWQIFFEFDHLYLGSAQRTYLEHRFGTIKTFNARNHFVVPYLVQIPYFVWLGRSRFPDNYPLDRSLEVEYVQQENPGIKIDDVPLTPFHYSITKHWRVPYLDDPLLKDFRTFSWAFTPGDSMELMRHLQVSPNDSVLFCSSAGDSALHLAIKSRPKQIHCIDANPCQNHLLELKLAAIQSLDYEQFFDLFGNGKHSAFRSLIDSTIAPYLSSTAYQFWKHHQNVFASSFYYNGDSGWALFLLRIIFRIAAVSKDVAALCNSDTLAEQEYIWRKKLRPVIQSRLVAFLLGSPILYWKKLGIPSNQREMLLKDGSVFEYIRATLDPVISTYLLKTENYFYHLALMGHYSPRCCPEYLTRSGFDRLKANNGEAMDAFRLHTKPMVNALRGLPASSLTHIIFMDHLDSLCETTEADDEIAEAYRVLDHAGSVFWCSIMRTPWYNKNFEEGGFEVTALYVRSSSNKPMDRVNIYASFFKATKSLTFVP
ncbi:S-adenosyl-L-methionine-dependent methyltransferase [Mycena venus]|uniref:S-adenosyl-L-methionine-dependent methyltransferase n=1 Tax=Mycena venus TaxID=2733690 RepID=A0A8H6Y716_9AGAR|nr:S-adenosyl-L-methionine-dependent methyltransferase [Mycena venus]